MQITSASTIELLLRKYYKPALEEERRHRNIVARITGKLLQPVKNTRENQKSLLQKSPQKRKKALSDHNHADPLISAGEVYFNSMFCGSKLTLKDATVHAVDLDGTLFQAMDPYDPRKIGAPLEGKGTIFEQVQKWIKAGEPVVILTARLHSSHTPAQLKYTRRLISAVTKYYFGKQLPCTAEKHSSMVDISDDRNIIVEHNTGRIIKYGK